MTKECPIVNVEECPLTRDPKVITQHKLTAADYEITLDRIASEIGFIYSIVDEYKETLLWLTKCLYNLSTAIRGEFTLTDQEVKKIIMLGLEFESIMPEGFVLPVSDTQKGAYCHIIRNECQGVLRMLHEFNSVIDIDQRLFDIFASLGQYFFGLSLAWSYEEWPFERR